MARALGVLIAIALAGTVAACGSKTPAQVAADELAAGLRAASAGDVEQAMTHYLACLKQEPANSTCLYNMGVNMGKVGKTAEAENYYRLTLAQTPDFPNAAFNLALLLGNRDNESKEAISLFRRYVQLVPDDPDGHLNLGILLRFTGDQAGAKAEFDLAVKLNPKIVIPTATTTTAPSASATPPSTPVATPSKAPSKSP